MTGFFTAAGAVAGVGEFQSAVDAEVEAVPAEGAEIKPKAEAGGVEAGAVDESKLGWKGSLVGAAGVCDAVDGAETAGLGAKASKSATKSFLLGSTAAAGADEKSKRSDTGGATVLGGGAGFGAGAGAVNCCRVATGAVMPSPPERGTAVAI
mmetsp:Transcript_28020/g.52576  ORF Transcript_28020/g.52576 Transcript_28020/m.52576 type:complete len:152 (+) Transcript_28020:114-569(+)